MKYKTPWPWYFILYWMDGDIVYHYWKPSNFPSWQQWKRGNLARKCFTMAILYCIFFCSFDSILEKQKKCFQFWHQFRFERLKCPTLLITWIHENSYTHTQNEWNFIVVSFLLNTNNGVLYSSFMIHTKVM